MVGQKLANEIYGWFLKKKRKIRSSRGVARGGTRGPEPPGIWQIS